MCGIFGYIGKRPDAATIVFDGLKLLEYRGYDSWGVAARREKGEGRNEKEEPLLVEKNIGKIGNISLTSHLSSLTSHLAIGHTRWATHGGVTVQNAHPHRDCTGKIALLQNGIVENFQELKDELLEKGHIFQSETDTETIVHLVEEYAKDNDFVTAVRLAFNRLKGLNAVLAINTESSEIVAAKNGSPLIIGIGEEELFIASDVAGILPHTRKVIFLKDNEMVVLGKELKLYVLPEGKEQEVHIETVDWKIEQADKGTYEHFMIKEVHEQSTIVRNIAQNFSQQMEDLAKAIQKARGTFFIGCGTAYHASMAGVYLFSKVAKKHVNTAPASEFNYLEDFLTNESLIIALSQSGETIDVIEPLTRAKQKGSTIAALVNSLGSTIYRMADYKLLLGAGPEKAVASTKAFTAKLSYLVLLSFAVAGKTEEARKLLLASAEELQRLLSEENVQVMQKLASLLADKQHIYTLGRGMSFATALEAALKIKEVSYIHTEGLAGGELKHGPIALIEKGTPCIVFAPDDDTYDAIISNATEVKARGGMIIGISSKPSQVFDHFIEVKDMGLASTITQSIPPQILAYYLALAKGLDPDKPRNLAKSVTVK
jgi:glucosamine--fructose-6-phosphate aminotransferase (isomerizing)